MNKTDYELLLDTVYRTWVRYEAMRLVYEIRGADGEPGIAAQLALVRSHRDRALRDLTTLRDQADDLVRASTMSRVPSRLRVPMMGQGRTFAVTGPGALDAVLTTSCFDAVPLSLAPPEGGCCSTSTSCRMDR